MHDNGVVWLVRMCISRKSVFDLAARLDGGKSIGHLLILYFTQLSPLSCIYILHQSDTYLDMIL